jgi:histidine triad (HIT) family protein
VDFYCDQILSGRVPVDRVAETGNVLAFHHTQPYWPVHIVIIPKRHIASLAELSPEDMPVVQEMIQVASEVCRKIVAEKGGCRLSTNCGDFQTTGHLHFYVHYGNRLRNADGVPISA